MTRPQAYSSNGSRLSAGRPDVHVEATIAVRNVSEQWCRARQLLHGAPDRLGRDGRVGFAGNASLSMTGVYGSSTRLLPGG